MKDLSDLINSMAPLYNNYKENSHNLKGTQALELMWEVGELLNNYIKKNKIKPHTLFRNIYGKSESSENITQKSYITREFQNRCYRIRKIFDTKDEIKKQLPNLKKFTSFREAMPFFDNQKYIFKGKEKEELLELLNSDLKSKEIISRLPKERIGIKNPRTQRLHELEKEKKVFIEFYNFIYNMIKLNNYDIIKKRIDALDMEFIKILSRNTSALAQDGLKFFELRFEESFPALWKDYAEMVNNLIEQKDPKKLRRFRRLIPPKRIVRLAEMIHALLSKENYDSFK